MVSIIAFGGVGKTSLVNAWLAQLDKDGWRGARRVYAWSFYSQGTDRLSSSDEFLDAALRWFGEPGMGAVSAWDKGERLAELVSAEKALLVLDGVEPLQWGPGQMEGRFKDKGLEALLRSLGTQDGGMCLVSSRIGLADMESVGGDKVVSRDLSYLSDEAGAELLRARGVHGTDEELREASKEYKGHGLALTLLGSYLSDVADGDVWKRHEIGPLEGDERQGARAKRVMDRYERWLRQPEVEILRMMGLFDRPATEGEIRALCMEPAVPGLTDALAGVSERDWKRMVTKLRRPGLLLAEEQDYELDAHPLVREHFEEQLRKENEEAWREGHRRLYEHLKASAKEFPDTIEEMGPLYAAVMHGCMAGRNQEAFKCWWKRIRRGEVRFSVHRLGAFGSEVAALSGFFDPPWERLAAGLRETTRVLILHQAGVALRAQGRLFEAGQLMTEALKRYIEGRRWKSAVLVAANLAEVQLARGELQSAKAQARASVELADCHHRRSRRMINRSLVGWVLLAMGVRQDAASWFEDAERMQAAMYPKNPVLNSLWGFRYCDFLLDQQKDGEVRERASRTLKWGQKRYPLLDHALDHLSLGRAHLLGAQRGTGGDLAQAAVHLTQAVDGLRRAGYQDHLALGLLARAALHLHNGAFPLAHKDLAETLSLTQRCGLRLHEADTHLAYTRLHLAEGKPDLARRHLEAARALVTATGYHRRDAELAELTQACVTEETKTRQDPATT